METYKISQIAKLLGLSSDTIRFYEKKGLVPFCESDNQYQEYDLDNIWSCWISYITGIWIYPYRIFSPSAPAEAGKICMSCC